MTEQTPYDTIVAGAGVAGLTVAHDLAARGYRVLVLEAADRVGGTAAALELEVPGAATLTVDGGAESFAVRGGAVAELAAELGLDGDIVDPNPAGAWLQLAGGAGARAAVPLPKQTLLGIPATPLAQDVIDVLGWGGALRAYLDRLMPVLKIGKDDALGPLVRRRMGRKVLDRLVAPLAGGVYSADPEQLDVAAVAPGLNNGITRTGSLSGGVAFVLEERAAAQAARQEPADAKAGEAKPAAKAGSAVQGIRGGIHRIPAELAERARAHHAELRTGVRVEALEPTESGWRVTTDAGTHEASSVVVALPEAEAQRLLEPLAAAPSAEERAPEAHASRGPAVELVTLVFSAGAITGDPRGTGVLVAADATGIRAKAMTHSTAKWPWLREAAAGHEIVRLSYGTDAAAGTGSGTRAAPDAAGTAGRPATEGLDDAAAIELALEDARAIFGTALPQPLAGARVRWQQGQPSATVGAAERRQRLRDAAAAHEQLLVVGAAVAGTGLAQVIPDARQAALEIRRERFAIPGTPWTAELDAETAAAERAAAAAAQGDPDGTDAGAHAPERASAPETHTDADARGDA